MLVSIELIKDEVSKFADSKKFHRTFRRKFRGELIGFRSYAQKRIKETMRNNNYPGLGVWQYIKTGNRMFVDTGGFERSFSGKYYFSGRYITGMRFYFRGTTATGFPHNKLARILTEGTSFKPSPAQRKRLATMAKQRGAPKPEGTMKQKWVIPPRPFIKDTFGSPEVHMQIAKHGARALIKTIREMKDS